MKQELPEEMEIDIKGDSKAYILPLHCIEGARSGKKSVGKRQEGGKHHHKSAERQGELWLTEGDMNGGEKNYTQFLIISAVMPQFCILRVLQAHRATGQVRSFVDHQVSFR